MSRSYFHLHLVSDSTGETLINVGRAAAVQYEGISAIEHVYPLVRSGPQLERVISEIKAAPGLVLYTLVGHELTERLEEACRETGSPTLNVLQPVHALLRSYLGATSTERPGAQHMLNAEYFKRIDAMNFTLSYDDGRLPENLSEADIVLLGISRTSKTPTSIYLAHRGYKTVNIPIVPNVPLPPKLFEPHSAFVVCLVASAERISEVRRNRAENLANRNLDDYVDRQQIAAEIAYSRRMCAQHDWPVIDVTRRSIEESAAAIIRLLQDRDEGRAPRESL